MAATGTITAVKRRSRHRVARRQQLIKATIASIAELGFSDTTLASVTARANLSHGTVNFHFKSKELLFAETLGYLAEEHHAHWSAALAKAGPEPGRRLAAIVDVDFLPEICSLEKLSVWFSFWGQVKYRPAYLKAHDRYDLQRTEEMAHLCQAIIDEGDYRHIEADAAARRIEAMIDGLWLNILLYPKDNSPGAAREDAFDFLALLFPNHFPLSGKSSTPLPCSKTRPNGKDTKSDKETKSK